MDWALDYIGRPYRPGGAGREAYDCWGLVRAVLAEQGGVILPPLGLETASLLDRVRAFDAGAGYDPAFADWRRVDDGAPVPLDVWLLTSNRRPTHAGVLISPDVLLHAEEVAGVVAVPVDELRHLGWRKVGAYRHPQIEMRAASL